MRTFNKTILTIALACAAVPAFAANESAFSTSGNLTFTTDYRVRGISQTYKEPAVQGEFDIAHTSGLYVGAWASNVSSELLNGASIEIDGYAGYKGKINDDLTYDVGFINYYYPGQTPGSTVDINTWDVYGGATWKWINVKYTQDLTDYFGVVDSKGTNYLEANVTVPLPADISLVAHYGHQSNKGPNFAVSSINDWKVGVSKDMVGLTWTLAYWDTNLPDAVATANPRAKNLANGGAILSVAKNF